MKEKFTDGEWVVKDDGYGMIGVLFKKGFGVLIGRKDRESIANAQLIAAAPDMYREVQHELACLRQSLCDMGMETLIYAATLKKISRKELLLAKASGQKQ